jgi:hypothetical protein
MTNEEVLLRVKEQRNMLHEISKRKANWMEEGGIEVTGRLGRRRRKPLNELKEGRGYSHLKEEAVGCTVWRAGFGRGFGLVVRQTTE